MDLLPSRRTVLKAAIAVPVATMAGPAALARAASRATGPAVTSTDWTMYRHGAARTGTATETLINAANAHTLVAGRSNTNGFALGEVITAGAQGFYKVDSTRVQAVTLATLTGGWRVKTAPKSPDRGAPAVVNGVVYSATAESSSVYAWKAATGAQVWRVTPAVGDDAQASVAVSGGLVYVAFRGGSLYALSAATGAQRWHVDAVHDVTIGDLWSSPAVVGGKVYVAAEVLAAYDAVTGVRAFSTRLPLSGDYSLNAPAVAGTLALVPSQLGLTAFDATTGAVRWHSALGDCEPVALNTTVVYAAAGGKLSALTVATGAVRWSVPVSGGTDGGAGVTLANGVVYVAGPTGFSAYSAANGAKLWSASPAPFTFPTGLTVSNGVVYCSDSSGTLKTFHLP